MQILVCGGAGYIGSHCVALLVEQGYQVIVIDNLSTGHRQSVDKKAVFYQGDIRDKLFLEKVFEENSISVVIHFSACSLVGESAENPFKYYSNNTYGTLCLLETMHKHQVSKIVFSSTAAVYGESKGNLIKEKDNKSPTNCYGDTKLAIEKMLYWAEKAYQIKYVIFRYFNVAGAHPNGKIGEDHRPETHLIPLILQTALQIKEKLLVFGDDYNTLDGTCIRDYIHVIDLINAHILAINYLENNNSNIFNLGYGKGFSVKEIIIACEKITKRNINKEIVARRVGDPAILIASPEKALKELNWKFEYNDLEKIISSAYQWYKNYRNGYD